MVVDYFNVPNRRRRAIGSRYPSPVDNRKKFFTCRRFPPNLKTPPQEAAAGDALNIPDGLTIASFEEPTMAAKNFIAHITAKSTPSRPGRPVVLVASRSRQRRETAASALLQQVESKPPGPPRSDELARRGLALLAATALARHGAGMDVKQIDDVRWLIERCVTLEDLHDDLVDGMADYAGIVRAAFERKGEAGLPPILRDPA